MAAKKSDDGFSAQEKAAMKAAAAERRAEARATDKRAAGLAAIEAAIAEMAEHDRVLAEAVHAIVSEVAPALMPKTWYGMPAWANADGKAVVFFQAAGKFDNRYCTLGFNDVARLDDGAMWPTSFAVVAINDRQAAEIRDLVARATSSAD